VIIDTTGENKGKPEVIGEVDFSSALTTVHPKAIYIHQGQQYHVENLDFDKRKAYVKTVNVDYYTDANLAVDLKVLDVFGAAEADEPPGEHVDLGRSRSHLTHQDRLRLGELEHRASGRLTALGELDELRTRLREHLHGHALPQERFFVLP